jgi:transposase
MSQKTNAVVASTIGIDTGKNTPHLVGLDNQGTILREKLERTLVPEPCRCSRKVG